jgi:hypothetical protein
MTDETKRGLDPVSPLGKDEPEPTPAGGVTRYSNYRYQKIDTNVIRIPVVTRPESQESTDEMPSNVIPLIKKAPRGRTPGDAA